MASIKNTVNSVTVLEKNREIIKIFKKYILPQFSHPEKITIIEGDIWDYLDDSYLSSYSYIFIDIWEDENSGYTYYKKIMKSNCNFEKTDFWIEDAIIRPVIVAMGLYFKWLIDGEKEFYMHNIETFSLDYDFEEIDKYFSKINRTITTSRELEKLLTNKKVIREILKG